MDTVKAVFVAQLLWFTLVFAVLVRLVVWPATSPWSPTRRAAFWVAPQMSRMLGLGLLVPNLSPGMPAEMSVPTAAGDATTAVLSLLAFVALFHGHRLGLALGWLATIVGIGDGIHALMTAVRLEVADNLGAQWFVPAINIPLMAVCHVSAIAALLALRRSSSATS